MDLKWLKTFMIASEELNYRKVSERLYITQPAVSLHIRNLEKQLGEKLFYKKGRHIYLTKFGKQFKGEAFHMIEQYENMLTRVHQSQQGYRRNFSIAMTPLLIESVFPTILRKYKDENPDIELSITVAESNDLPTLLEKGNIDLALSCLPSPYLHHDSVEVLEDTVTLIVPHDGQDAEIAFPLDAKEMLSTCTVFTDHHPFYWDTLKKAIKDVIPHCKFLKVTHSHAAKRFILEGMGISFLPTFATRREIQEGRLLKIDTPFLDLPEAKIYAISSSHSTSRIEHNFLDFLALYF